LNKNAFNYAGFRERFAACLLDVIILWVLLAFLGNLLNEKPDHIFIGIVFSYKGTWLSVITGWLYFAIQESSVHQGTLGKRIFKVSVVGTEGPRISFLRATGRYFAKYISYALLLAGFFMMLWDKHNRTLHDRICDTFVLKNEG
jgi:uncharacterized RDD family membrane protein YckC